MLFYQFDSGVEFMGSILGFQDWTYVNSYSVEFVRYQGTPHIIEVDDGTGYRFYPVRIERNGERALLVCPD